MAKDKTMYVCSECGQEATKWVGKCPTCGQWNTMKEIRVGGGQSKNQNSKFKMVLGETPQNRPIAVHEIQADAEVRIDMGDQELNRVLGGGLVEGSLVLLGGEPGIGKSTLILQTVLRLQDKKILYVSGEESARQIKLRADRLQTLPQPSLVGRGQDVFTTEPQSVSTPHPTREGKGEGLLILCETSLEAIYEHIAEEQPDLVVIDSIQTIQTEGVESSPGSLSQIRECAASLLKFAKSGGCSVILIGHITKEGTLAGPKVLEHIVDCVLQFEGDQHYMYRILRAQKNRFGSTSELGIYEMLQGGLRQVSNPSELLLTEGREGLSGIAICSAIEGVRPLLIETQALVSTAAYGTPQRSATGFDNRRLGMLLAVLEKRVGFKLAQKDVFLNIAGGLRVTDPAMDLSVIAAVLSSNVDAAIDADTCLCGEVGLSGEIRPVSRLEQRIAEAEKLGFRRMLVPAQGLKGINRKDLKLDLVPVHRVAEAVRELFG
ncbi:MAG: DNA repair protein RadA [Bacteroidaceae bacterium]|nr:DNA repair protein RadA [Bacteroidaceae bacterium]